MANLKCQMANSFLTAGRLLSYSSPLHLFYTVRNQHRDVMGRGVAIGKRLIQSEVRQRQTRQWRLQVVARVDANRAVVKINSVTAEPPAQGQERRRRVAKHAR